MTYFYFLNTFKILYQKRANNLQRSCIIYSCCLVKQNYHYGLLVIIAKANKQNNICFFKQCKNKVLNPGRNDQCNFRNQRTEFLKEVFKKDRIGLKRLTRAEDCHILYT